MTLTPHQKRQLTYVILLIVGIPLTIFAVYKGVQLLTNASGDTTPQDVVVTNLTTSSLSISWVTDKAVDGYVVPVLNGTEQNPVLDKRGTGKRQTHYVVLKGLEPSTEYFFTIVSDNEKYSKGTLGDYKFTSAQIGEETPVPNPVYGTISGANSDAYLVYALFKDKSVYPVSSEVPSNGNWIIQLSSFRKISDKSLTRVTDITELIIIARDGLYKASILEGAYSELFNASGRLNEELILEEIDINKVTSYFPAESILGTVVTPIPDPEPDPKPDPVPTPTPTPTPIPTPTPQNSTYVVRQDVPWGNLTSGSTIVNANMTTGEESILIANLTDINFVIAWRSNVKEQGYVKFGKSKGALDQEINDTRDTLTTKKEYFSHYIDTGRLEPDTTYYFEVHSGDTVYDNDGKLYTVTTYPNLSMAPALDTREGKVINTPDPSDLVLVFNLIDNDGAGTSGSSGYLATIPDTDSLWMVVIGDARSSDGSSYFTFSDEDILQATVLGAEDSTFDFNLGQNDIELDVSKVGGETKTKVALLLDYGIVHK